MKFAKPIIVVSQCLEFEPVRYNGQMIPDPLVRKLNKHVDFRPVCPEVAIGLGVPRDPVRLIQPDEEKRMVQPTTGRDVTDAMNGYSRRFLESLPAVDGFILKFKSPSCGIKEVKLYRSAEKGTGVGKGSGLFADAVTQAFPDYPIEDEGRLRNFRIREHFLTRIFSHAALRDAAGRGTMGDLVRFHSENKYLLLAWNQKAMRELGRLVANHSKRPVPEVWKDYRNQFIRALHRMPANRSHLNVLTHALGYFSKELSGEEKAFFLDNLTAYSDGKVPLSVPVNLIRSWIVRFNTTYLMNQRYFQPFPMDLVQVTDSGKGRELR